MASMNARRLALRWAGVALAAHLAISGVMLAVNDGQAEWFLHLGDEGPALPLVRDVLGEDVVIPHHDDGHDGPYFWLLARDPLLSDADTALRYLDRPAYRSQRIAYPVLSSPWGVAGEEALVWGMLVTNLLAVAVGAYGATLLAVALGAPARAGLAYGGSPATIAGVLLDGSDALALAAVVWALYFLVRRRIGAAVAVGALAVLAKEPMLLALGGVALLAPGVPRRWRVALVAAPAAAAAAWALYARSRLGWPPSQVEEFTVPFGGYLDAYRRGWRPIGNWSDAVLALALVPLAVGTCVLWWRRRTLLLSAAVPFAVLVPFFTAQVLNLPDNSLRAIGPLMTLVWLSAYVPRAVGPPASAAAEPATARP
jgi:hypothetical protein